MEQYIKNSFQFLLIFAHNQIQPTLLNWYISYPKVTIPLHRVKTETLFLYNSMKSETYSFCCRVTDKPAKPGFFRTSGINPVICKLDALNFMCSISIKMMENSQSGTIPTWKVNLVIFSIVQIYLLPCSIWCKYILLFLRMEIDER